MKKTYINPSTKVCEIKYSSSLLTGSVGMYGADATNVLSRDDDNYWDEEDW